MITKASHCRRQRRCQRGIWRLLGTWRPPVRWDIHPGKAACPLRVCPRVTTWTTWIPAAYGSRRITEVGPMWLTMVVVWPQNCTLANRLLSPSIGGSSGNLQITLHFFGIAGKFLISNRHTESHISAEKLLIIPWPTLALLDSFAYFLTWSDAFMWAPRM